MDLLYLNRSCVFCAKREHHIRFRINYRRELYLSQTFYCDKKDFECKGKRRGFRIHQFFLKEVIDGNIMSFGIRRSNGLLL